ncbi:MAG: fumarate hydratase [Treponema sp.]|jgi:fumarate hydratase subunit alpha|nr:fumarate hydratase [Treponema sp.]
MRIISAADLSSAVKRLFVDANRNLPGDMRSRIRACREKETWAPARETLDLIIENFELAEKNRVPICQDTGMACVFLEIGCDVHIEGDVNEAVNQGVREACKEGYLRSSVVADPLRRKNTGDNTPAVIYTEFVKGGSVVITVAPKGFGSENMSRTKMLVPSQGREGVIDFVVSAVNEAGPNPCPPVVVGVGIGGTFDKAALLSKKALIRSLDKPNSDPYYAALEETLLEKINALGIGPQGFGGATTALAVAIETMPTHIAGLPCAVNINCHVSRHASEVL